MTVSLKKLRHEFERAKAPQKRARHRGQSEELIRPSAPVATRCPRCRGEHWLSERFAPERWDAHQAAHDRHDARPLDLDDVGDE